MSVSENFIDAAAVAAAVVRGTKRNFQSSPCKACKSLPQFPHLMHGGRGWGKKKGYDGGKAVSLIC